jgi:hypothetical protein
MIHRVENATRPLLFGWASGGRRRSEIARATMENLRKVASRGYLYALGQSKTNQDGRVTRLSVAPSETHYARKRA